MNEKGHQVNFDDWNNWPNRLTLFRILLIPFVVACLLMIKMGVLPEMHSLLGWTAGWTFVVASITDGLDGYLARKRNIVTIFGSFLDPIADKFLVVSSLIMLLSLDRINVIIVIILVLREIYITSLRLLALNEGVIVPVNSLGKWKTIIQMIGIPMMMANEPFFDLIPFQYIGPILLYVASFLAAYSAFRYTQNSWRSLKQKQADHG